MLLARPPEGLREGVLEDLVDARARGGGGLEVGEAVGPGEVPALGLGHGAPLVHLVGAQHAGDRPALGTELLCLGHELSEARKRLGLADVIYHDKGLRTTGEGWVREREGAAGRKTSEASVRPTSSQFAIFPSAIVEPSRAVTGKLVAERYP